MSSIVKAFSDLLGSVFEVFSSIINTILSMVQSVFAMAGSLLNESAHLLGGTIEFLFSNIFIIGTLVAVFFAYILFTQRQAKPVGAKKTA